MGLILHQEPNSQQKKLLLHPPFRSTVGCGALLTGSEGNANKNSGLDSPQHKSCLVLCLQRMLA